MTRLAFCCTNTNADPWLDGLRAALPEADVSLWRSGDPVADYAVVWAPPQDFFDQQPGLKAAFNIGAGVDALLKLQIAPTTLLVRLDDAGMAAQMAEYVCHAIIRAYRGLDHYAAIAQTGRWQPIEPPARTDFPVGIMGLGVLGARVAQAVRQFEFPVNGWSRTAKALDGIECFHGRAQLPAFLAATRVLVCLIPLTPDTRGILNRHTLAQLPPGGVVINVARGAHLVDDDLLALLDSGHLSGATLDVFHTEPLPADHPFWRHPKVTVTPHVSAQTLRQQSITQIAQKLRTLERGEAVAGMVDRASGY